MWLRVGKEDYCCPSVPDSQHKQTNKQCHFSLCKLNRYLCNVYKYVKFSLQLTHLVIFGHKSIANFVLKAGQELLRLHFIIIHIFSVDRIQIGEKLNIATDKTY